MLACFHFFSKIGRRGGGGRSHARISHSSHSFHGHSHYHHYGHSYYGVRSHHHYGSYGSECDCLCLAAILGCCIPDHKKAPASIVC